MASHESGSDGFGFEPKRSIPDGYRRGIWNCDSGVQFPIEQIAIPGVTETQDPLATGRMTAEFPRSEATEQKIMESATGG